MRAARYIAKIKGGKPMRCEAYEKILDFPFYHQMRDLIVRSTEKTSGEKEKRSFLGENVPERTMEDQYGLRYPGEVLERYQERVGEGREILRATALALADKSEILEDNMFVGSQKEAFLRKLRAFAGKDVYLCGALYLLSDKESERERLRTMLLGYSFSSTQEILFVLSVFYGEFSIWERFYPLLVTFLGKGRTIKAYQNEGIYTWFIDLFEKEIKNSRGKDAEVLKALRELPVHHVMPDSKTGRRLTENGYSEQEILYLNLNIPPLSKLRDSLTQDSIVMERIAAAGCESLFNAQELEDPCLFKLCTDTLQKYQKFAVKLKGYPGLKELLTYRVYVKNVDFYCYLLGLWKEEQLPDTWFHVNLITESKWNELAGRLSEKEYRNLFEECILVYGIKEMDVWLNHYENLTGKRYENIFWKEKYDNAERIFREMILQKKYDIAAVFRQYATDTKAMAEEDCKEKWNVMLQYIRSIGRKLYCHGIFRLWEEIDAVYGIQSLDQFMENRKLLVLAVNGDDYWNSTNGYYGRRESFWKNLDFLNKEESIKLFFWAEEYFYRMEPERYNDFLHWFIKRAAPALLPAKEGRALMEMMLNEVPLKSYEMDELRQLYYKPEEWDAYRIQEKEREKRKKEEARQNAMKEWRKEVQTELGAAGTENKKWIAMGKKLREVRYGNSDNRKICLEVIEQELQDRKICAEKEALAALAEELLTMVERNLLEWKGFQKIIENMEVSENESADDGTAQ